MNPEKASKSKTKKELVELFAFQEENNKAILDEDEAVSIESMIQTTRGHRNFEVNLGDTIYKYFIQDQNDEYFIKYGTNLTDMINDIVLKREIVSKHSIVGTPVIRI
jgi:hypothetical protein